MKKERDYSTGKIYKIWSFNSDKIYIGSTIQALSERLRGHERCLKHYKKTGKKYCGSYIILENEHYDIELIEYCPCKTKDELYRREGELQREMNCVNQLIAGRTKKEHYEDNKEEISKKNKEYREKNPDIIIKNRKKYYEKNIDKIKERKKIRIICECGQDIAKVKKARHIKSLLHINLMEEKKNYIKIKIIN